MEMVTKMLWEILLLMRRQVWLVEARLHEVTEHLEEVEYPQLEIKEMIEAEIEMQPKSLLRREVRREVNMAVQSGSKRLCNREGMWLEIMRKMTLKIRLTMKIV